MYIPQEGDVGMVLYANALRDYLMSDQNVTKSLKNGADGFWQEGMLRADTPTPCLMLTLLGDGDSSYGRDVTFVRHILWALDRGRGYQLIENALTHARARINNTPALMEFMTFPPGSLQVLHAETSGGTASTTFPNWKMEGRGIYVFSHVRGLTSAN